MTDFVRKLFGFLHKLFVRQQAIQPGDEDTDLTKFYTDSEYALQVFEQLVTSTNLPKHLLVIHGIGGVGKSTLLKMYDLFCRKHNISVALVASEEAPSPVDVLADWADDLSHEGVALPTFQKTLNDYRAIRAKVETEANKTREATSQLASTLGKTAAKTAITIAAGAIPIVGPVVGSLGGQSADAFIDWLCSFLSKPDMELYLDPIKRLDMDFFSDLNSFTAHQRIVLMVDTYERMTALDDWTREFVRRLPKNVLLVIAGRLTPAWESAWQGWMGKAVIVELKEMTPDDLRILIQRYYAYIHSGDPDPQQVEAIVQFARGLPLAATTVVQLWVKYGAEDFLTVRPQVVADLADYLLEGVPQEKRSTFEAAAVLRYFNVDTLDALLNGGNAEALYAELRRWPFIRSRREGLAVHDTIREMINEALHMRTPERFRRLHEQAAKYYEEQLEKATGDERERCILEELYHCVCVDEGKGIQLFQEIGEELTRYRMLNRLRALLNDVYTYQLEQENSRLWRDYYNTRLAHMQARISNAEEEEVYKAIGENKRVAAKLRAYALSDWGIILCRRERLRQQGMEEKAIHVLESSLEAGVEIDVKLAAGWVYLCDIYTAKADWEKALAYLEQPRRFFTASNDFSGLLMVREYERRIYARQGNLRKMFDVENEMMKIYAEIGEPPHLRTLMLPKEANLWAGRYVEHEKAFRQALETSRLLQDQEYLCWENRDLALALGLQGRRAEALATAEKSLSQAQDRSSAADMEKFLALTIYGIVCLKFGELENAEKYLKAAIPVAEEIHAKLDAAPLNLAIVYEMTKRFDEATQLYLRSYQLYLTSNEYEEAPTLVRYYQILGRHYFECGALTGMIRVKYATNDNAAIPPLWTEAERLAQQYEYNDYLAVLYLIKGHTTWDSLISKWEGGFDSTLHAYKHALIYALRYNRFLLDEALSGREQVKPLHPIIPHCLEHGEEGQRMLIALRDWWQSGINDSGTARPDTISPIRESMPLLEAERIARKREPGDGSSQKYVVEQMQAALTMAKGEESPSS